jgi:uncharacterized protein with PQ loop repeat
MSFEAVVAVLTTVLSVGVKVIGMPEQIKANRRRKSTEGLSGWFMICTLLSYGMWVIHGFLVHDMSLIIGQSLGVLVTTVIVWQMIMYRKTAPKIPSPAKTTVSWSNTYLQRAAPKPKIITERVVQD